MQIRGRYGQTFTPGSGIGRLTFAADAVRDAMEATVNSRRQSRGTELLLHHCRTVGGDDRPKLPARERLEAQVGSEFAQLLVLALTPQGRRGSSSP